MFVGIGNLLGSLGGLHDREAFEDLTRRIEVTYGAPAAPAPAPLVAVEPVPSELPSSNIKVVEHLVGATVVRLENGDVIRCHLFVTEFSYSSEHQQYLPMFRVVPEVVLSAQGRSILPVPSGEVN